MECRVPALPRRATSWGGLSRRLKTYGLQSLWKSRGLAVLLHASFMLLSGLRSMRVGAFLLVAGWGASPSAAQPPAIAGTMPEDALPGLQAILRAAWTQSPQATEK